MSAFSPLLSSVTLPDAPASSPTPDQTSAAPPQSVRTMLDEALAELRVQAAEISEHREKAAQTDELRAQAAENSELCNKLRAELLELKKATEQVHHEDTLFHSVVTVTSKTKMEKTGTSLIHTKREELRSLFVEALDQALPSPPSAGVPPPAAIVHALSEKDAAVLLYRNLAVRNMGGMTSLELFEFHLRVVEDSKDPNLITLRTLSDDEARRLCGDAYVRQVEAKREKVDLRKLKRVQVRSYANGSERQRSVSCGGGGGFKDSQTGICSRFARPLTLPPHAPPRLTARSRSRRQISAARSSS
jgi:hypothetical protein